MKKIFKLASPFVILISVVLIILFRTVPAGSLWEKYVVLYVPVECQDDVVLNILDNVGIKDVVSLSGQFLPLNISEDSLEYIMFKTTSESSENQYLRDRNAYFFDKSNKYRLYYIPKSYERDIGKCMSLLKKSGIYCGLDSNARYPVFFPLIIAIFAIVVSFFCKKRFLFLISSSIPVLYVFCNPFFPVALSICLIILCSFFIVSIWKRKGAISYMNSFFFIPICLVVALLCGFASSLSSGFLFIAVVTGVSGIFITYSGIEDYHRSKKSFIPVYIRSAEIVTIYSSKVRFVFAIVAFTGLILFGIFSLTSSDNFSKVSSSVQFPGASEMPDEGLPQLEDYYKWVWNITTYPYKSLNNEYSANTSVVFPEYSSDGGLINVTEKVLNYDSDFKDEIFGGIDELSFNSIEKVIKSEGRAFEGGYNSTVSYHLDLFGIIMIIMCYFVLLFIYFSIIMKTRKGAKK